MSVEAMAAVLSPRIDALGLSPSQRHLLLLLANGANADGECWPSVAYLVEKSGLSRRGVQTAIAELESRGLLIRADRKRRKDGRQTSNLFELRVFDALPAEPEVDARGAVSAPLPAQSVRPRGAVSALPTTLEPSVETTDADASDTCARKSPLDRLKTAWRRASPGRLSPAKAAEAFAEAARICNPEVIAAAGERYLAEDPDVRRLGTATSLHKWLAERCWEAWAEPAEGPATPAFRLIATSWCGPPEVRAALAAAKGEDFAASWLDPAGWDADRRALLPATGIAADTLRQLGARMLAQIGVDDVVHPTRNLFADNQVGRAR